MTLTLPVVLALAVGAAVVVLVLRKVEERRADQADAAAEDFRDDVKATVNELLTPPQDAEPTPLEQLRDVGGPIPRKPTTAELRAVVEAVKGGAAPLAGPTTTAAGTQPGTPPAAAPADALAAAVKTLEGLRPQK